MLGVAETGSGKTFGFVLPAAALCRTAAAEAERAKWAVRDLAGPT
eukprot:SAG22_NODE_12853_length_427_cov_0.783537_1_plen_44_part_01